MADLLGIGRCPICQSDKARVSLSKKGLACLTCMGCQCQVFARSARSDDLLRNAIPAAKPEAANDPVHAADAPPAPPAPPAKPEKPKRGFFDIY